MEGRGRIFVLMKTPMTTIDQAGTVVANEAMRLVARHPRMSPAHVDNVIAAMKAATPGIVNQLIDDMTQAPTVSMAAIQVAILDLAGVGMKAIQ